MPLPRAAGEDARPFGFAQGRLPAAGTAALLSHRSAFRRGLWAALFLFMNEKNDNSGKWEREVIEIHAVGVPERKAFG